MLTERRDEIAWNFTVHLVASQTPVPYDQLLKGFAEATGQPRDGLLHEVLDQLYATIFARIAPRVMAGVERESHSKINERYRASWLYLVHYFYKNGIDVGRTMRDRMVSLAKTMHASGPEMLEWYDELVDAVITKARTQR